MPKVLVVDDAVVDRRLVGGLLAGDPAFQVEFAGGGREALELIARAAPNVVVTDLRMPEMDGMQLVEHIRQYHPLVPVILMTSVGSEEIAVQALRAGASSYVPKRLLAQELISTVHSVLSVAIRQRNHARVMQRMASQHAVFVFENDSALIPQVVGFLQEHVTQMGICDDADRMRIGVALEEALVNAVYHGNLEVTSHLREQDDRAYYDLIERRSGEAPYRDRRVHVEASLSPDLAVFVVRDEGNGFDPTCLPDPTDPANLDRVCGRGVLLMRTFMDEVRYNERGNEVTLTKRRRAPQAVAGNGAS